MEIYDNVNNRHCSKGYTINRPNVWEYKTITFPPDFSGRMHPANTLGFAFYWWLFAGSTYAGGELTETWQSAVANQRAGGGTANIGLTSGATWEITGIQAEIGKVATPFEYLDYETQLALCQRYYQVHDGHYLQVVSPTTGATADFYVTLPYWVPMNHGPDVTESYTLSGATTNNLQTVTQTKAKFSLRPTTANSEIYVLADTLRLDAEL